MQVKAREQWFQSRSAFAEQCLVDLGEPPVQNDKPKGSAKAKSKAKAKAKAKPAESQTEVQTID